MANLIALQLMFKRRSGSAEIVAHPGIEINDQVIIWERTGAEQFVHYVTGIDSNMDLDAGTYMMTLSTYWLGHQGDWAIRAADNGKVNKVYGDQAAAIVDELTMGRATSRISSMLTEEEDIATVPLYDDDADPGPDGSGPPE